MIKSYSSWKQAIGIVTVASLLLVPTIVSSANRKGEWRSGGQNLKNTRYQATEEYLSPANVGKIIWQTANPTGALDTAPLTVANGVVYAGSLAPLFGSLGLGQNNMYALDAETGNILWGFNSGGSVNAGAAVVDGTVYWGSGYSRFGVETQNNKLYAFTVLP